MAKILFSLRGLICGLMAAMILAPVAASAAGYATVDIRNKSDVCVFWQFPVAGGFVAEPPPKGMLRPGESAMSQSMHVGNTTRSARLEAQPEECATHRKIGPLRYDNVPSRSHSELSIHKQSPGVYIMKHGP
jgi:hypothetical protein